MVLWRCSSTQQIVVLSAESEYISITMRTVHALEFRSAIVNHGLTLKVVCETDPSAGRAMATRRESAACARLLWLLQLHSEGLAATAR